MGWSVRARTARRPDRPAAPRARPAAARRAADRLWVELRLSPRATHMFEHQRARRSRPSRVYGAVHAAPGSLDGRPGYSIHAMPCFKTCPFNITMSGYAPH